MTQAAVTDDLMMYRAALAYAAKGWPVFPIHSVRAGGVCSCGAPQCGRVGKHPRTRHGFKEASTKKEDILKWWSEWPDANIGVVPWPAGLIILDIDPRNGGNESLEQLEDKYGKLPDTAQVFTGGGGRHIYFTLPTGVDKVPSRVLLPGVELKAMGGYVLAPPSGHLSVWLGASKSAAGPGYAWDLSLGEHMVDAPFWLVESPPPGKVYEKSGRPPIEGLIGAAFTHAGMTGRMLGTDKVAVQCPWESQHSQGDRFDSSTVVFGPSSGNNLGHFHCSHSHCFNRTWKEVLDALPKASVEHAKEVCPKAARVTSTVASEEWEKHLARKSSGALGTDPGNLMLLIENLPEWKGALRLDESRGKMIWCTDVLGRKGRELQDGDYIDVGHWFRMQRGVTFRKEVIFDVLHHTARRAAFNSLHEHLNSLPVGSGLLDSWLVRYCGVENTAYHRSIGRWWLISAMARAFDPGVQVDHCLVLEGDQGAGKSTLLRTIGGDWYDDTPPKFESTDALMSFQGVWIREFGELAGYGRTEFATIKALITERVDRFRPPYGRQMIESPRRCVFCASVNPGDDYVRDATGARRFWPVKLPKGWAIPQLEFFKERDALLGEALQAYRDGEPWHPPASDESLMTVIRDTQGARQVTDPWSDNVLNVARTYTEGVTMNQLFSALGVALDRQTTSEAKRIGTILRAHGYERKKRRDRLASGSDDASPTQHWVWVCEGRH